MLSDYDVRVLHCNENWFDVLTWFWVVVLPLLVLMYAAYPGYLRGDFGGSDPGFFVLSIVPFGYVIICIAESKYLAKRWVSATIWLLVLYIMWYELPLWFYAIYLSVPVIWFIKHIRDKKNDH